MAHQQPAPPRWQLRFDGGRQQRYLPDRRSVLHYVLAIGPQAPDPRFEVWAGERVLLADGSDGGAVFSLAEVIDLSEPGAADRVRAELTGSAGSAGSGRSAGSAGSAGRDGAP